MFRIVCRLWAGALLLLALQGCAHFVETQTIQRFAAAMKEEDLQALQKAVSEDFNHKALRLDESVDDLKVLRLPTGDMEVSRVESVSDDEKLVEASPADSKRKLYYRLKRTGKGSWRIDDILVSQSKDGLTSTKSVSEQMDLLSTVREFISAWDGGQRQAALKVSTSEFAESINSLPPGYFETLAERIAGEHAGSAKIRPQAQIGEEFAIVRVRRSTGEMVLSFELEEGRWKVSDVAVEASGDGEHVPSVRKMASVVRTSIDFLEAYARQDREALSQVSRGQFFRRSLNAADLTAVALPDVSGADAKYSVSIHGKRAFFEIPGESQIVRIDLLGEVAADDPDAPTAYAIEEVTVYELEGQQEKRLSVFFTALATARLFHQALAERNKPVLAKLSTTQFNERVWQRVDERTLSLLDFPQLSAHPEIVETTFHGALTQIDLRDNGAPMTVVLRQQAGELRVDDVHVPAAGRPSSLRETWDLTIPVVEFSEGIRTANLGRLQRNSSRELTRLIWQHVDTIPPLANVSIRHLATPLSGARLDSQHALLSFGDDHFGARVQLIKEHGYFVVDNIQLIAGVEPRQRVSFKETVRRQIILRGPKEQQVAYPQAPAAGTARGVASAGWVEPAEMQAAQPLSGQETF